MPLKLTCNVGEPPVGALLTAEHLKPGLCVNVDWATSTCLQVDGGKSFSSSPLISRYLARLCPDEQLYGSSALEHTEVDHWIEFAVGRLSQSDELPRAVQSLDRALGSSSYLVGQRATIADFTVWGALFVSPAWQGLLSAKKAPQNVSRWYNLLLSQPKVESVLSALPPQTRRETPNQMSKEAASKVSKEEGKFVDLPGAEVGKVVVRFPPEASGYLHVGHAKAALLNQYYQEAFKGKLIMRFDDTNPEKEKEDFEKVILDDVKKLEITPDRYTFTSDYFELLLQKCEELLRKGLAYVDDTDPETMKAEREQRQDSKNRGNSVEKNLQLWEQMKKGTEHGLKCCVRAKIDMKSNNGCMRDPALYRCKIMSHPRTGDKYKVYPTYDFACPIVDSIEGVTHALRTTEYHDRDEQFFWVLDSLGMRKPHIYEYSRLNMMNTVLSKRKLTWFVENKIVDGWDDPRMPTVRGVLRRGMTVEGLKQFIVAQGSSRSVVMMDWDKIWAFNKKVIEPVAPRHTTVEKENAVVVEAPGLKEGKLEVAVHPKNTSLGTRDLVVAPQLLVDQSDARAMKAGENVTFIGLGNLKIKDVSRGADGKVTKIVAEPNLDDKNYKNTLKVTWLAVSPSAPLVPCTCVFFDHILSKQVLGKDDDFKDFVRKETRVEVPMLGDPLLKNLKKSDIIQIQRKGFFICDQPYDQSAARHISQEGPLVLYHIPDGTQSTSTLPEIVQRFYESKETPKEQLQRVKGKAAEKSPVEDTKPLVAKAGELEELSSKIQQAGDQVRQLKASKAEKSAIDGSVAVLLKLKGEFKKLTGKDWQPSSAPQTKSQGAAPPSSADLDAKIQAQGEKIRKMKADKVTKDVLDPEIKELLRLKADYKSSTGIEWKPGVMSPSAAGTGDAAACDVQNLDRQIEAQGDKIRMLKSNKAAKDVLDPEIKLLFQLKADFKSATGQEWKPATSQSENSSKPLKPTEKQKEQADKAKPAAKPKKAAKESTPTPQDGPKKITRLGLEAKKEENLPDWYSQVITKAEMIEYYDVSGCYILRPWAYSIWENIKEFLDTRIRKIGVQNCYFPMFVSAQALEREKTHVADFAPEVAWVTRSGNSDLAEPIAIRPTSETVMYPSYAKWVQSHRDLPLQLNQWCNIVRWEFKHPQPFLRTREFLWQEGHTAFATREEAVEEVYKILDIYTAVYEELLALPVVRGRKTEKEKFAGADFTTTVEAYVPASGRGIQGATSHHLGQNFSKMFEIVFEDPETREKKFAFQNSWGLTTRTIGVVVMVHADNQGLVLPPRVACYQVVIVPCGITAAMSEDQKAALIKFCQDFEATLDVAGVRCKGDYRDNYSPGWKFNHWELKGVPIRVEIGPRDMQQEQFVAVRRDTGEKLTYKTSTAVKEMKDLLENIQKSMFDRAKADQLKYQAVTKSWGQFLEKLDGKCLIMAPFCGDMECEDEIKKNSAKDCLETEPGAPAMGAKSLCIPFEQPAKIEAGDKCINPGCARKPSAYTLFGRSY
ncbi:bifunctional glutamate/proline--tRNA ligase [Ixodes scapularis]|uniref:bifunctional glutamate/proline--tRNA ligase n=1 Tax=Ixodes scapularis TaxID=6945 RepID=UPI001A9E3F9F|nr:bifunctional glutamate/proline--tRNA ligase [Ixodes scapularis]